MRRCPSARRHDAELAEFDEFVRRVEPRLRVALVATYGSHDGRAATVDALSWAWEHWDRLQSLDSPVGYLFRVGQSASRRTPSARSRSTAPRPIGAGRTATRCWASTPSSPTRSRLSVQQRTVVTLVHAFGWTQRDVAQLLELNPSTVREHLDRALTRLTHDLEVRGVR
jgi:DNA-directed RNA polymerase specialized sigma24 family protein